MNWASPETEILIGIGLISFKHHLSFPLYSDTDWIRASLFLADNAKCAMVSPHPYYTVKGDFTLSARLWLSRNRQV